MVPLPVYLSALGMTGMTALPTFLCVDVMKRPAIDADVARYEQHLAQVFNLSV